MNIVLGTMTFGEQLWESDVKKIINRFFELGYKQLDTAYVYNDGKSEELLGSVLREYARDMFIVDTKVNPRITGSLDKNAVKMQLEDSLERLGIDYIDTYYIHFPDKRTPLEETLYTINEYYKKGFIKALGLSNFPADLVRKVHSLCQENEWVLPSVYEGLYNPISRKLEIELDDCLTELNISLNCYNPLAGGILTNKYDGYEDTLKTGRFTFRPNYRERYWNETVFEAVRALKLLCEEYGIGITEAAFRWLANSSALSKDRGDGIIIGISNLMHLDNNIKCINQHELPGDLIRAFELAWNKCKCVAPDYYRFYEGNK